LHVIVSLFQEKVPRKFFHKKVTQAGFQVIFVSEYPDFGHIGLEVGRIGTTEWIGEGKTCLITTSATCRVKKVQFWCRSCRKGVRGVSNFTTSGSNPRQLHQHPQGNDVHVEQRIIWMRPVKTESRSRKKGFTLVFYPKGWVMIPLSARGGFVTVHVLFKQTSRLAS
jgi:hypothetical protein